MVNFPTELIKSELFPNRRQFNDDLALQRAADVPIPRMRASAKPKRRPRAPLGRPHGPVANPILEEDDGGLENEEFLIGDFRRWELVFPKASKTKRLET